MQQLELVKVLVQTVVAVREDGTIVNEIEGPIKACYTADQIMEHYAAILKEVDEKNAELAATNDVPAPAMEIPKTRRVRS